MNLVQKIYEYHLKMPVMVKGKENVILEKTTKNS